MQLEFHSISEAKPDKKWQALFNKHWPAYKAWFLSKPYADQPDLKKCQARLMEYMPEFYPTYERLCELAGDDVVAHQFLTGYRPPAYISGCAQVVFEKEAQLVRNYDFDPDLSEGTVLHSAWNGRKVMAMGDCLSGVVDGMNADGLVVSLTFGGRKAVGDGFGIPFILRYVLEFCSTLEQAQKALLRIPSHMSYNIMLMDGKGDHRLIQVAPDHKAVVTDLSASTNHQGTIDWPEHAAFTKTLERELYLHEMLTNGEQTAKGMVKEFLKAPLFNRMYGQGFGTIYTAVYRSKERTMELRWPRRSLRQSMKKFKEGITRIKYSEKVPVKISTKAPASALELDYNAAIAAYWVDYGRSWSSGKQAAMAEMIEHRVDSPPDRPETEVLEALDKIKKETEKSGQIPWDRLAELWSRLT